MLITRSVRLTTGACSSVTNVLVFNVNSNGRISVWVNVRGPPVLQVRVASLAASTCKNSNSTKRKSAVAVLIVMLFKQIGSLRRLTIVALISFSNGMATPEKTTGKVRR